MKTLLYFLISNLLATTVTVQSLNSPDVDFQNYTLKAKERISYINHYKQRNSNSPELDRLLKKAQFEFLKGSLDQARILFEKVCQLQHEKIWSKKSRKKIHYAFFRWAQLTPQQNEKEDILKEALMFDDQLSPNSSLFPPPLVETYYRIKKGNPMQVWALPENSEKFDQILINGAALTERSGFIRKTKGLRKVTFLSNKYQVFDVQTTMENLESLKVSLTPLASEDCNTPGLPKNNGSNPSFELYDPLCQSHGKNLASQSLSVPDYKNNSIHNKETSLFGSRWFWIGVSVVVGGLILHQVNENQRTSGGGNPTDPVTTQKPSPPAVYTN